MSGGPSESSKLAIAANMKRAAILKARRKNENAEAKARQKVSLQSHYGLELFPPKGAEYGSNVDEEEEEENEENTWNMPRLSNAARKAEHEKKERTLKDKIFDYKEQIAFFICTHVYVPLITDKYAAHIELPPKKAKNYVVDVGTLYIRRGGKMSNGFPSDLCTFVRDIVTHYPNIFDYDDKRSMVEVAFRMLMRSLHLDITLYDPGSMGFSSRENIERIYDGLNRDKPLNDLFIKTVIDFYKKDDDEGIVFDSKDEPNRIFYDIETFYGKSPESAVVFTRMIDEIRGDPALSVLLPELPAAAPAGAGAAAAAAAPVVPRAGSGAPPPTFGGRRRRTHKKRRTNKRRHTRVRK